MLDFLMEGHMWPIVCTKECIDSNQGFSVRSTIIEVDAWISYIGVRSMESMQHSPSEAHPEGGH